MTPIRTLALCAGILLTVAPSLLIDAADRLVAVGQPAPEITGGPWLNSGPLSLAGLRGRVVLVEFWTYG
jgi:hypothetical protein